MSKSIIIVGAGISGLAVLHYLKRSYVDRRDIQISLLERNADVGGTIRSIREHGCIFETGPNGFLDSKETTLDFVRQLGLEKELIVSNAAAQNRCISLNTRLHQLPQSPVSFLRFQPLSFQEKVRILKEPFIPKGGDPDETVYEFGCRRLGQAFADLFLDPMVTGIFAGDVRELNLRCAFPRMPELEAKYGSLVKGMFTIAKEKRRAKKKADFSGQPAGRLLSFRRGMGQLTEALYARYRDSIVLNQEVATITRNAGKFQLKADGKDLSADEIFLCVPAYRAAEIIRGVSNSLAEELSHISYAPVAVVGLVYPRALSRKFPKAFGYLIPSSENREVLGVLFSSHIFTERSDQDHFLVQVMLGGSRHPGIGKKSEKELLDLARRELQTMFSLSEAPVNHFSVVWPRGIPQYTREYARRQPTIEKELQQIQHLHLVANYWGGISLNDCIANAQRTVENSVRKL